MHKLLPLNQLTINSFYYFHWAVFFYTLTFHFSVNGILIAAASYFLFGCLGIEVNAHRYFSHKSFEYKYKWMEYVFSWFTCLGGTGAPIWWSAIHFDHHKHADKEGDPHNPRERGLSMIFWLKYPKSTPYNLRHVITPYQRWLHANYFFVHLLTWFALWFIGGFWLVAYAAVIPSLVTVLVQFGTIYFCHSSYGYKTHKTKDNSKNVWVWSLFDFGEGLHNNHHANPSKWSLKEKWYEIDISGAIIALIRKNEQPLSSAGLHDIK